MSRLGAFLQDVGDTLLRMVPHRAPTGLVPIGRPGRDAPVLVTGNYTLTVRRLRRALAGHDVWLLCADSRGINVWCASGGGHFTHHDVIAAMRSSRLEQRVDHREVVLPQLCATGVERRRIEEATGFLARWGPARLEDLPAFLARGRRVVQRERVMRFPLGERLEMAAAWGWVLLAIALGLAWGLVGAAAAVAVGVAVVTAVAGLYAAVPRAHLAGRGRWAVFAGFAALGAALGSVTLVLGQATGVAGLLSVVAAPFAVVALLGLDFEGTTPWYASALAEVGRAEVELVEDRCSGAAACVQVCPRGVLAMDGRRRKVRIAEPGACIRCAACIVQCPEDALRFRFDDGRVAEATTIRRTRLNMLGKRTVELRKREE
ncbi:MAG: 4Fe-4S dicluster domain-containing protein [Deinococcales bacterium]